MTNPEAVIASYLSAYYYAANPGKQPSCLSYEKGWFVFRHPNGGAFLSRRRRAQIVEMTQRLMAQAVNYHVAVEIRMTERRTDDGDPFNAGWNAALDEVEPKITRLRAERDQLVAALKGLVESDNPILEDWANANAALAAVEDH